jgi:hypothetical protein
MSSSTLLWSLGEDAFMQVSTQHATNNDVAKVLHLQRAYNGGAGANNIGARIQVDVESATNGSYVPMYIDHVLTNATLASADSRVDIYGYTSGSNGVLISIAGSLTTLYSTTINLSAVPATDSGFSTSTLLVRDSSGNLNKLAASGGGTTNFLRADGTWAAPPGGGSHTLLNGSTHTDTVSQTVSRGSIIVGKTATPVWDELVLGTTSHVLQSDGSDLIYGLVVDANIGVHTSTKISITSKSLLNSAIVYNDQANIFGDFAQTFKDNQLFIQNPAETFEYRFVASAIVADRDVTLPLLGGNDTFVMEAHTQTLTNKTLTSPVINVGSDAGGDTYYRSAGGAYTRLAIGAAGKLYRSTGSVPSWSTLTMPDTIAALSIFVSNSSDTLVAITPGAGQSIRINAGGTAWEAYTPGGGGGAPTTAEYLVLTLDGTLTNERRLVASNGLVVSDGGANNDYTIKFGGTLTADTDIDGAFGMDWGSSTRLTSFRVYSSADILFNRVNGGVTTLINFSSDVQLQREQADTSSILATLTLLRRTTGTAANGLGNRLNFGGQDNAGSGRDLLYIDAFVTDVSSGSFDASARFYVNSSSGGGMVALLELEGAGRNISLGAPSTNYQSMERGLFFADAVAAPTGNPASGVFVYVANTHGTSHIISRDPLGRTTDVSAGVSRGQAYALHTGCFMN